MLCFFSDFSDFRRSGLSTYLGETVNAANEPLAPADCSPRMFSKIRLLFFISVLVIVFPF